MSILKSCIDEEVLAVMSTAVQPLSSVWFGSEWPPSQCCKTNLTLRSHDAVVNLLINSSCFRATQFAGFISFLMNKVTTFWNAYLGLAVNSWVVWRRSILGTNRSHEPLTHLACTANRAGDISIACLNLLLRVPSGDCSIPACDVSTPRYQLQIVRLSRSDTRSQHIKSPVGFGSLNSPSLPTFASTHSMDWHFTIYMIFFLTRRFLPIFKAMSLWRLVRPSLSHRRNIEGFDHQGAFNNNWKVIINQLMKFLHGERWLVTGLRDGGNSRSRGRLTRKILASEMQGLNRMDAKAEYYMCTCSSLFTPRASTVDASLIQYSHSCLICSHPLC